MKIKELIKKLKEVEQLKPNSIVYLSTEENTYDFTRFGCDDICDVDLYVVGNDREA